MLMSINKVWWEPQSCSFLYISSVVAFTLQWHSRAVVTETVRPTKPEIFTVCPVTENLSTPALDLCSAQSPVGLITALLEQDKERGNLFALMFWCFWCPVLLTRVDWRKHKFSSHTEPEVTNAYLGSCVALLGLELINYPHPLRIVYPQHLLPNKEGPAQLPEACQAQSPPAHSSSGRNASRAFNNICSLVNWNGFPENWESMWMLFPVLNGTPESYSHESQGHKGNEIQRRAYVLDALFSLLIPWTGFILSTLIPVSRVYCEFLGIEM